MSSIRGVPGPRQTSSTTSWFPSGHWLEYNNHARLILFLLLPVVGFSADSEFVLVRGGTIFPSNAVAVSDIASNAVQAVAVAQSALVVSNAAAEVEAMIDDVADVINSVEGIGIFAATCWILACRQKLTPTRPGQCNPVRF